LTTIGIDARAAAEVPAGRGRFVRELLLALTSLEGSHDFVLYGRRRWPADLDERFRWVTRMLPDGAWHLWAALAASRRTDVFLSTNSYLTAWFTRVPTGVVVYDLIPFLPGTAPQRRAALIERATIERAVRRAKVLICISEATRRDLEERFPTAAGRTVVTPLAAAQRFAAAEGDARPNGSVLCVGTLEPRKNLVRAIDAYDRLPRELRDRHPLVIAGAKGWDDDGILRRAETGGARVVMDPDDRALAELYRACAVFLFPSLYEGFGLPLLEAMSAGAACITSDVSSLPEVGADAVRYADPESVESIASELEELLRSPDERARLGDLARARAAEFTWSRTAHGVLTALERVRG
jgi:alpha-1,3-rhamnosyl/mannosyltransferase